MKRRQIVLLSVIILILIVGVIIFVLYNAFIKPKNSLDQFQQVQPIVKEETVKKCNSGDMQCEEHNRKLSVGKISGKTVEFVKHQCDGPRECSQPNKDLERKAVEAINKSEKESGLSLIRITGINASGLIYYCTQNGHCWSFNTKTEDVVPIMPSVNLPSTPSN